MGSHAKNHGHQKRKNTPKGASKYPLYRRVAEQAERRDDEMAWQSMEQIRTAREAGFLKRKYSE